MEKQTKLDKRDILIREWNKHTERKIMLELQILLQEKLPPDEISAQKPSRFNQNNQPISYQSITRKEHIEILRGELESVNLVLETIENM